MTGLEVNRRKEEKETVKSRTGSKKKEGYQLPTHDRLKDFPKTMILYWWVSTDERLPNRVVVVSSVLRPTSCTLVSTYFARILSETVYRPVVY